jgi:hypothetical protein
MKGHTLRMLGLFIGRMIPTHAPGMTGSSEASRFKRSADARVKGPSDFVEDKPWKLIRR